MTLSSAGLIAKREAEKYSSTEEFKSEAPYVFWFAEAAGILDEVTSHMNKKPAPEPAVDMPVKKKNFVAKKPSSGAGSSKWTHQSVKSEALKYETKTDFKRAASGALNYAVRHGILAEVTSHMVVFSKGRRWTHELVFQEAKKFSVKEHFKLKSFGAFHYARRNGILDDVCAHMGVAKKSKPQTTPKKTSSNSRNSIWTHESVRLEALKYQKRTNFKEGCRGAHRYAVKHGIYDEVCAHMSPAAKNGYSKNNTESPLNAR